MNKNNDEDDEKEAKNNIIEKNARIKTKEYFNKYKSLTKNNVGNFLEYIGLSEIWSTEEDQNFFWEELISKSENKEEIDYDTAISSINDYFKEEEEDMDMNDNKENNKLSYNENDNDLLIDIDLQSVNMRNNSSDQEEKDNTNENNKKSIEEFIKTIKDKQNVLYSIRFINEIYFYKYLEEENAENNLHDNNTKNNILINKNKIINEINSKYEFINLDSNYLNDYFNIISCKNNDKLNDLLIEKSYIRYANEIIKNTIYKDIDKNIKIKPINLNLIKMNNISNNINIVSSLEKLKEYDSMINKVIEVIKNIKNKNSYSELAQEYIEKYIINLRNSIYEDIKSKDQDYEDKLFNLIEENKKLKSQNEKLIKENLEFLKKLELKVEEKVIEEEKMVSKFKLNDIDLIKKSKITTPKTKSKIIIPLLKIKSNTEEETKISSQSEKNIIDLTKVDNESISSKKKDEINEENRINSQNDLILEDLTDSNPELFSIDNNNIEDQFLLDTTRLCHEDENINKNKDKKINNYKSDDDLLNYSNGNISDRFLDTSKQEGNEENNEDEFYDIICTNSNERKNCYMPLTDRNYRKYDNPKKDFLNLNNGNSDYFNINKAQSHLKLDFSKILLNKRKMYTNEDIFYGYVNKAKSDFYDFKYLIKELKIKKLFRNNNEKIIKNEFFNDEIKACLGNYKKKKYIIIITYKSFYFLKSDETYECELKLSVSSLKAIIVSKKNFNLLHLNFKGGTDIIIETYQRIEMLRFLQTMIDKGIITEDLTISASNYFFLNKKNGKQEKISTIKNSTFAITPNFENSQKIGVLLKYKEGFFSSYFQEKLIVLCSIGLIFFDDDYKTPKNIIPVIGTTIKFIVVQLNKKIYCLRMKTINEEVFILGSTHKKEIFDWLKELAHYKKVYQLKMKQINPKFICDNTKDSKNSNIMFF